MYKCVCVCVRADAFICVCVGLLSFGRVYLCALPLVCKGCNENLIGRESCLCCAKRLNPKDIKLPLSHNTRSRMIIMRNLACAPLEISRVRSVAVRASQCLHNCRDMLSDCSMLASVDMQIALLNISHAALEPVDGADQVEANFIALIVPPFGHGSKVCISARAHTLALFEAHLGEPFLEI